MQIPIRQAFESLEPPPLNRMRKIARLFSLVLVAIAFGATERPICRSHYSGQSRSAARSRYRVM